ncbi:hypothetical protein GQ53DRAFT_180678 [Thozetella sp. PMI_491]|nr:hypothetical protein GQ53DRAFT_180678 [Thozetella sp. PMI_491]
MWSKWNILLFTATSSAIAIGSPASAANNTLLPWEVTDLTITQKPTTQGHHTSVSGTIHISIKDRNANIRAGYTPTGIALYAPSAANCTLDWTEPVETLWGITHVCADTVNGDWSFQILPNRNLTQGPPSPLSNFILSFTHVKSLIVPGAVVFKTFVGAGVFRAQQQLEEKCWGMLDCAFSLRPNKTPGYIYQNMTACVAICDNIMERRFSAGIRRHSAARLN